ncbi:MAG: energy-coupling factor transporter ATPase, partial [Dehalococcoidales bacterium]|nr:energy-coupling factor transporter ATPase [Dehalococcoidales bacterium]
TMATKVGMVFQDPENQLVTSDVSHEICFGMENLGFPDNLIAERLEESLRLLDLDHLRNRPIHELSGGEKQRTIIASVLALRPDILILDEPTSELDPEGACKTLSRLRELNYELGLTVIIIEHRLDNIIQYADRVIVMEKGQLVIDSSPESAMSEYGKEMISYGIGLPPIVQLFQKLANNGITTGRVPLSVNEASHVFAEVFNKPLSIAEDNNTISSNDLAVELQGVSFVYPNGIKAIDNISLHIYRGEAVAILGRNGSGKTTLVKLINGLLAPNLGALKILGRNIFKKTVAELANSVGVVFQNPADHLFTDSVEEEIAFGLKIRGFSPREISKYIDTMLDQLNLGHCRGRNPLDLSSGEKQRLALASVLVYAPPVLVLDEPDRGTEEQTRQELTRLLRDYCSAGNTVVIVTHDVEMAASFAQRVIVMDEGKITLDGNKHEVFPNAGLFSTQINCLVKRFAHYGVSSKFLTADEVAGAYCE